MKKNLPTLIAAVSTIVALASIASAIRMANRHQTAETEVVRLRKQIADMKARVPGQTENRPPEPQLDSNPTNNVAQRLPLRTEPIMTEPEPSQEEEQQERRASFEERMAQFKEEDPEGYAAMIQQRRDRQQSMRYNLAERTATFMDMDTSSMTGEELENHEQLVEKMANVWALTEQFQDPEEENSRETMRALFSEMREVRPLLEQERTVMFKQLGTDLGYEGEDAAAFAAHVEEIISTTTLQMPRGGGRRGRGGRDAQ
jgi:hypothetical protein